MRSPHVVHNPNVCSLSWLNARSISSTVWRAVADSARSRSRSTLTVSPSPDSSSNWVSPCSRSLASRSASAVELVGLAQVVLALLFEPLPQLLQRAGRQRRRQLLRLGRRRRLLDRRDLDGRALAGFAALAGLTAFAVTAFLAGAFAFAFLRRRLGLQPSGRAPSWPAPSSPRACLERLGRAFLAGFLAFAFAWPLLGRLGCRLLDRRLRLRLLPRPWTRASSSPCGPSRPFPLLVDRRSRQAPEGAGV